MEIIGTIILAFLILLITANLKTNKPEGTKFKIYLKDSGYKIVEHDFKINEFKEGDVYYNKEEYIQLLKSKYNSDKIEVSNYSIYTSKIG
jgi:hypothetical protein